MTHDDRQTTILQLLKAAISRRKICAALDHETTYRLVHGEADQLPHLTVDTLDGVLLLERHRPEIDVDPIVHAMVSLAGSETPIFVKERWAGANAGTQTRQVAGPRAASAFVTRESGLAYQIDLCAGEHIGLFLDAREARRYVQSTAEGARTLNLFSYTGAFGVAAAAGGARSTTNVDNKRSALEIARRNYDLNGLAHNSRSFLKDDVLKHLKRAAKGRGRYDLVIVDPPPRFSRPGRSDYKVSSNYTGLVAACLSVLEPGGRLVAGLNSRDVTDTEFERLVLEGAAQDSRAFRLKQIIGAGPDFPTGSTRPTARFAVISRGG